MGRIQELSAKIPLRTGVMEIDGSQHAGTR